MIKKQIQLGWDLITAVRENTPDLDYIAYLVAEGADLAQHDDMNATALYISACFGHKDVIEILIHAGADINHCSTLGASPLAVAAQYGHGECVDLLIAAGARLDTQDNIGYTPVIWAAYKGHEEIVEKLVEAGADLSLTDKQGHTAAYLAWSNDYDALSGYISHVQSDRVEKAVVKKLGEKIDKGCPFQKPVSIPKWRKPKI